MTAMATSARIKTAIALNAVVVVLETCAISYSAAINGIIDNFVFYTQCSNLMGAIACLACLIAEVRDLRNGRLIGRGLRWFKYAAVCCTTMTFFVVLFVLVPMMENAGMHGWHFMYVEGSKSITHLFAPVLIFGSYVFLEADRSMTLRQSSIGLIFTLVYAVVAYVCNYLRLWDGPYPFFQVWNMPLWQTVLWFIALLALAFALCQLPRLLGKRLCRKTFQPSNAHSLPK